MRFTLDRTRSGCAVTILRMSDEDAGEDDGVGVAEAGDKQAANLKLPPRTKTTLY